MLAKPTQQVPHGGGLRFEKAPTTTRPSTTGSRRVSRSATRKGQRRGHRSRAEGSRSCRSPARRPVKVIARYHDGQTRDVTKEATSSRTLRISRKSTPPPRSRASARRSHPARSLPGQVCHPTRHHSQSEARLRVEGSSAEQLHRSAHRRQAAEAPHSALARHRRRCLSSASFPRFDGQLPTPEDVRAFLADTTPSRS